jgi:uncharacterized protein YgfB (UPF0149 family)
VTDFFNKVPDGLIDARTSLHAPIPANMANLLYFGHLFMNQITSPQSYTELTEVLENTQSEMPAAEAHGLLCGIICATSGRVDPPWGKLINGSTKNPDALEPLQKLYATSYQQLSEFSLEFTLLLPADDIDINIRAEALGFWCQGFLIGLKQGPRSVEDSASSDAVEALTDITEIAQVNHGDISSTDEDESAYFDLVEYVRLAVLMLYHEFKSGTKFDSTENDNLLH